jgi:hypothetical protein
MIALYINVAGIPITLTGNSLRPAVRPNTEFGITETLGCLVLFQGRFGRFEPARNYPKGGSGLRGRAHAPSKYENKINSCFDKQAFHKVVIGVSKNLIGSAN